MIYAVLRKNFLLAWISLSSLKPGMLVGFVSQNKSEAVNKGQLAPLSDLERHQLKAGETGQFSGNDSATFESNYHPKRQNLSFNDPLYADQWYLHGGRKSHPGMLFRDHINVVPVWMSGITGQGIRISVLDDGVCGKNLEIANNYDASLSGNFVDLQTESTIPENSHGTYCAAISSGVANNNVCGVGVAFEAAVGGARVLSDYVTDAQEASGLVSSLDLVDIYTASWGPEDDGRHVDGPGKLAEMAFLKGVTEGRNGKGAVYVWASGNGAHYDDHCSLDGYASSPYTLTFGALTKEGKSTYYTEPCASVIASAYVGGYHVRPDRKELNTSAYRKMVNVIVPEENGKCRENFQGTSAAAPIASGVIALILQANPELTWRDVQHILVETAKIPSDSEGGWSVNGAGRHFHAKIGFGAIDAAEAVSMARSWSPVGPLYTWTTTADCTKRFISPLTDVVIYADAADQNGHSGTVFLETVLATLNIRHPRCGNIEIFLTSPSGTSSQLLSERKRDNVTRRFSMWNFASLHFWGENKAGTWTLRIFDRGPVGSKGGILDYFRLTFLGTFVHS